MLLNISVYYFEDFCINYIHSVLSEILRSEFIILFSLLNEKKDVNIAVPEVQMIIEWGHFHYFPGSLLYSRQEKYYNTAASLRI